MIVSGKVCVSACSFLLVGDQSLLLLRGLGFGGVVVGLWGVWKGIVWVCMDRGVQVSGGPR